MVVAFPVPAKTRTAAQCAAARKAAAGTCALLVKTPKAAVKLARRNVADYAVLPLGSLKQLNFLQGVKAKTHIVAVARPSVRKLNRPAWVHAVKVAAADPVLDLVAAVDSTSQPTLGTYLGIVDDARGSTKTIASAPDDPPTAPGPIAVSNVTATSVTLSWPPSQDDGQVAGYGVYRSGLLVGTVTTPQLTVAGPRVRHRVQLRGRRRG